MDANLLPIVVSISVYFVDDFLDDARGSSTD